MNKQEIPPGHLLLAALLPAAVLAVVAAVALWLGWGWARNATDAFAQGARSRKESAETSRRITELRANKPRVDAAWLELSAGTLRLSATAGSANNLASAGASRPVALGDAPLTPGAAASTGLGAPGRSRDLPDSLQALSEANLVILPQPGGDRRFRRWVVGTDRVEFGRLLPLLASVESRFPLALVEEVLFGLPANAAPFGSEPRALESRLMVRLPVYDAAARQAEARERQRKRAPAARPAGSPRPGAPASAPRPSA